MQAEWSNLREAIRREDRLHRVGIKVELSEDCEDQRNIASGVGLGLWRRVVGHRAPAGIPPGLATRGIVPCGVRPAAACWAVSSELGERA